MKYLPLSKGLFAKVDDSDYEWAVKHKWHIVSGRYAGRDSEGKKLYLHRIINNTPDGFDTDHINRDKLDNRRINLRTVTRQLNMNNCDPQRNNTSGYRGVSWHKQRSKWSARTKVNGVYKSLGLFSTPEAASKAYEEAVALKLL